MGRLRSDSIRICAKCNRDELDTEFYTGRCGYCKDCMRNYQRPRSREYFRKINGNRIAVVQMSLAQPFYNELLRIQKVSHFQSFQEMALESIRQYLAGNQQCQTKSDYANSLLSTAPQS